jgi:hypothetical protein
MSNVIIIHAKASSSASASPIGSLLDLKSLIIFYKNIKD